MHISHIAMNRMAEERAATDRPYRQRLEKSGKVLLSAGRRLTDEALLEKLESLGVDMDRERFEALAPRFVSAEAMAAAVIEDLGLKGLAMDRDWIWIAFTCFWERWLPGLASFEGIDDRMQEGYEAVENRNLPEACRLWLQVWAWIEEIMDREGLPSLEDFDSRFGGSQAVCNWVHDLEMELRNAGNRDPRFHRERIRISRAVMNRLPEDDAYLRPYFRTALGESHMDLGETGEADALFEGWLREDPQWGSGWAAWSDGYHRLAAEERKDASRAEDILRRALAVPGVRDRDDLLDQLEQLLEQTGQKEKAEALEALEAEREEEDDAGGPLRTGRPVRRNASCPCGSGRKYKKCCGPDLR